MVARAQKFNMKKNNLWLFLFLPLMIGCSPTNISSNVDSSTSYQSSSTSSEDDGFVSTWGNEIVEEAIENSIQFDIPYFYAPKYIANPGVDAFGDPILDLFFLGFSQEESIVKAEAYANVCKHSGYDVEFTTNYYDGVYYDVYYATIAKDDKFGIQLQIVDGETETGEYGVGVNASIYVLIDELSFPNVLIDYYLGYTIPELNKDYFTYYGEVIIQSETLMVYIELENAIESDEIEYYNLLLDNNYLIDDSGYYDGYGYVCLSQDQTHVIQFAYMNDSICIYTFLYQ